MVSMSKMEKEERSELAEIMLKFKANSRWMFDHLDDLRKDHLNEYIAVYDQKLVDGDKDFKRLVDRLRARYTEIRSIVIEYIAEKNSD